VKLDGEKLEGYERTLEPGAGLVLQVGRRKFVRVV
jgi:tyrosyl-tRNA synthetase